MEDGNHRVELLAPAGNAAAFYGAVHGGADAVYLAGDRFGARAYAENFTVEELLECLRYGHLLGRKLYLAVNTLLKEEELDGLYGYLLPFYEVGMDAVIVQDLGVLRLVRERFPGWKIHASTQMTLCGGYGASMLKEMGACRVVPARELGLDELVRMKRQADIEVEVFVHGAMCYCYSGQCLFSSILGGRSGNRGRCAQPCRLNYSVETEGGGLGDCYPLSLKDMCAIGHIPRLIEAGIDSFKIEGRMKKPEYAAGVTAVYRRYIDKYYELREKKGVRGAAEAYRVEKKDWGRLRSLYIRSEVQDGYFFRRNGREMLAIGSPSYSGSDEVLLEDIREKHLGAPLKLPVSLEAVFHEGKPAEVTARWQGDVRGARQGREVPAPSGVAVTVRGGVVERAQRQPVTEENIKKQLGRLGESAFYAEEIQVSLVGEVFYPLKEINELRREAVRKLEEAVLSARGYGAVEWKNEARAVPERGEELLRRGSLNQRAWQLPEEGPNQEAEPLRRQELRQESPSCGRAWVISVRTKPQLQAAARWLSGHGMEGSVRLYVDGDLILRGGEAVLGICGGLAPRCVVYAALPYILRASDGGYLDRLWEKVEESGIFRGYLARSLDGLGFVRSKGCDVPCRTDAGVYVWNTSAMEEAGRFAEGFCLPYELRASEQRDLLGGMPCEKIVYSRIPMMVTANCLRRTAGECGKYGDGSGGRICRNKAGFTDCGNGEAEDSGRGELNAGNHAILKEGSRAAREDRDSAAQKDRYHVVLKDRYRIGFPVEADCLHCMNIIYNSVPFSLYKEIPGWKGRADLRVDFTLESAEETEALLDAFLGGAPFPLGGEATAGHEKRGVE